MLALFVCAALMLIWAFTSRRPKDQAPSRIPVRVHDEWRFPDRRGPRG